MLALVNKVIDRICQAEAAHVKGGAEPRCQVYLRPVRRQFSEHFGSFYILHSSSFVVFCYKLVNGDNLSQVTEAMKLTLILLPVLTCLFRLTIAENGMFLYVFVELELEQMHCFDKCRLGSSANVQKVGSRRGWQAKLWIPKRMAPSEPKMPPRVVHDYHWFSRLSGPSPELHRRRSGPDEVTTGGAQQPRRA